MGQSLHPRLSNPRVSTSSIRLGTWNVERANLRNNPRRLEIIHAADADLWVLTETRDELDLGSHYSATSSTPGYRTVETSRWVTIWSRYPTLTLVDVCDPSRTVAAILDSPLGSLLVYGTVLPWHSDRDPHDTVNWAKHHRVISQQAAEWAALRQAYPDAALCVAGDLNMNIGGPHYYGTKQGRGSLRVRCSTQD